MPYEATMRMDPAGAGVRRDAAFIPLPPVVDTAAVVFLGFLAGSGAPVVLDASQVREVQPAALPLLEAFLASVRESGFPARMTGVTPALRRQLAGRLGASLEGGAFADDERIFVCPDRDAEGFQPSPR